MQLLLLCLVTALIFNFLTSGTFLAPRNLQSMASQLVFLGLLSLAILLAFISGGIDLSVVATANMSAVLEAMVLKSSMTTGVSVLLGIIVALASGIVMGAINGLLIGKLDLSPILATLGTMQLYGGITILLTGGPAIYNFPPLFLSLGGSVFGIPIPFIIFILISIALSFILSHTAFGYRLLMLGSAPVASRYSGTDNTRIIIRTYILIGILAAIAGVLLSAQMNAARHGYGATYLLLAILASIMAGVDPQGGEGPALSVVVVVLILQFLKSGFSILGLDPFFVKFFWGLLLLTIMVIRYYTNNTSAK